MLSQLKLKTYRIIKIDRKYRDCFEILALILEATKDDYATRFSIAKCTKTNYAQLNKYLQFLVKTRFIETHAVDGCVFYKASVKGIDFLKHYNALLDLILDLQEIGEDIDIAKVQFARQVKPQN